MSLIKIFLKELEQEAQTTRKMLVRVPTEKFDWQPHPKSMTVKRLITHIADLPGWIDMALTTDQLDFQNTDWKEPEVANTGEVLAFFEQQVVKGNVALENASEDIMEKEWILRSGETVYGRWTKAEVIRMSLNQIVHHRAQLGVFLRLLDIPIPGSYGPSADEQFAEQEAAVEG